VGISHQQTLSSGAHSKCCLCKKPSAEFTPDPALDTIWISYQEPFHQEPFHVIKRVKKRRLRFCFALLLSLLPWRPPSARLSVIP
jgi:hypothetical protein